MSKKTITKNQRLALQGLITIGQYHSKKSNEAYDAMCEMLGEKPNEERGFISDAIFNEGTVDQLLKQMAITVK